MANYRYSYSDAMTAMIEHHGQGKSQEFFIEAGDRDSANAELEKEINAMSNSELVDLMEMAGVIRVQHA